MYEVVVLLMLVVGFAAWVPAAGHYLARGRLPSWVPARLRTDPEDPDPTEWIGVFILVPLGLIVVSLAWPLSLAVLAAYWWHRR